EGCPDLLVVQSREFLELLAGIQSEKHADADARHPIVLLGVDQIEHHPQWKGKEPPPAAFHSHTRPPVGVEHFRPGFLYRPARREADENVLEKAVDLVLFVENGIDSER